MRSIIRLIMKSASTYFASLRIYFMYVLYMWVYSFAISYIFSTCSFPKFHFFIIYYIFHRNTGIIHLLVVVSICIWLRSQGLDWLLDLHLPKPYRSCWIFLKRVNIRIYTLVSLHWFWIFNRKNRLVCCFLALWVLLLNGFGGKILLFNLTRNRKWARSIFCFQCVLSPSPLKEDRKKNYSPLVLANSWKFQQWTNVSFWI